MTTLEQLSNDRKQVLVRILSGEAEDTDYRKHLKKSHPNTFDKEIHEVTTGGL